MVQVERAKTEHDGLVHELTLEAFDEFRDSLDPIPGVFLETVNDVQYAIEDGAVAIARVDDRAVGAVRWQHQGDSLYAGRLAVLPDARKAGVGSALMDFVEDHARTMRFAAVMVGVRTALPGNIAFFQNRGYFQIAEEVHPRNPAAT